MKHLKRKLMMTLALLLTAATGAWADETLLLTIESKDYASFKSGSKTFDDKVTITFSSSVRNDGDADGWYGSSTFSSLLTVTGTNGYTITSCKFYTAGGTANTGYTVEGESPSVYLSEWCVFTDANKSVNIGATGVKKIEVYTAAAPSATTVPLTWDAATPNTATLTNGMPAGNVTVSVDYFAQAELAKSTDPTPVPLAPAAIANVPANTDAPIVTPGTVANIGTSEVPQGTLMYFVIQPTDDTTPTAPDYDTDGWSENVPTANELKQGNVYVWYYIEGAEPANIADRTDANTRSDSDIKPLGTNGIVTLDPEPTYDVSLNKTGMAEGEPAKWSAKSTNVTTAVNLGEADLEGVKKSETVTVTYSGDRKVIGVKAEKKAAEPASTPLDNTTTAWTAGTYVVPAGGLTYSDAITVSGDVTLTLTDGEMLTLNKGISLASGATLTIQGNGTMNVNGTNESTASTVAGSGTITLTSGTLTAKGGNGGDGGAEGGAAINGTVIVDGGTLTAKGGNGGNVGEDGVYSNGGAGGAAISGSVTVNSGTLTATGGNGGSVGNYSYCCGGGAGVAAISGDLTINSGTVTSTNGANGQLGRDTEECSAGAGCKAVAGTVTDNR